MCGGGRDVMCVSRIGRDNMFQYINVQPFIFGYFIIIVNYASLKNYYCLNLILGLHIEYFSISILFNNSGQLLGGKSDIQCYYYDSGARHDSCLCMFMHRHAGHVPVRFSLGDRSRQWCTKSRFLDISRQFQCLSRSSTSTI